MSQRALDLRRRLAERVRTGDGRTSREARQAAFDARPSDPRADALVERVARHAWTVQDADVRAPLDAGLTDDEVFELVVCAAIGQATRQLEAGLAALDEATAAAATPTETS